MLIKTLVVGQIETNCYIVTDETTLKCAIIDPGDESNVILDYIESNSLHPEVIFLTHGHFDHVLALPAVHEELGIPAYICEKDAYTSGPRNEFKLAAEPWVQYYKEGDVFTVGELEFYVMETPGHSPGSVCLVCRDAIFSGDTLFRDSCGRTDLDGGDMATILVSLLRLYKLDGDFEVYPGHMGATTLSRERKFNYYMRYAVEASEGRV